MSRPTPAPCHGCGDRREQTLVQLGIGSGRFDYLVALAGNPNTGKSTVFNTFTGLRQHTGNWPGKTVARAEGTYTYRDTRFKVVDLPGTYSLQAGSPDEEVARDFILFGLPDVTVVVVDATRLERNLNLALQILEITDRVVVCLNLVDEARRHGIAIDDRKLSELLGVPVVVTVARTGEGIPELRDAVANWYNDRYDCGVGPSQVLVTMGVSPALLLVLSCMLDGQDQEIILGNPCYPCSNTCCRP